MSAVDPGAPKVHAAGRLVLVATPIGNLGDMTSRAIDVLRSADVIACEDTRHTRKLLNHFEIRGPKVIAVHQHNERAGAAEIVERVGAGETVALVTDAGMPGISDPGEQVVAAMAEAGLPVTVAPGASAVPAALAVSGLPTERFCFDGFLPAKGSDRQARLRDVAVERRTVVLYEAPHRLARTAADLARACGDHRRVALVRELTKLHEEVWRGSLSGLVEHLDGREVKGECVLVVEGAVEEQREITDAELIEALDRLRSAGSSSRDASAMVAEQFSVPRKRVYALATRKPTA